MLAVCSGYASCHRFMNDIKGSQLPNMKKVDSLHILAIKIIS